VPFPHLVSLFPSAVRRSAAQQYRGKACCS
jgi:hypothetical protein